MELQNFRKVMRFRNLQSLIFFFLVVVVIAGAKRSQQQQQQTSEDKQVLVELKRFLQANNKLRGGAYDTWPESDPSPCGWHGVRCNLAGLVESLDLSGSGIFGPAFGNFSRLRALTRLDISANSIDGVLPADDLGRCGRLVYLNLSGNLIGGHLGLAGLTRLRTLDASQNRFHGATLPATCRGLAVLNVSTNSLAGSVAGMVGNCTRLEHVDISSNAFAGDLWHGVARLKRFDAAENGLAGTVPSSVFAAGCSLQYLDLTANRLRGDLPNSIENCRDMAFLSLGDNEFSGLIPAGIGAMARLETMVLAGNHFDRRIPPELTNCTRLRLLDMSSNGFGGEVQETLGKFASLRHLMLRSNMYTSGIVSSGILRLPFLARLDLSYNSFSGELPGELADAKGLRYLFLRNNNFSGTIPARYGGLTDLQLLSLSRNALTGTIPASFGNLTSLLWLLLDENRLSGRIPPEIGNCSSLLNLNLKYNRLSGNLPPEVALMGSNPWATFSKNRNDSSVLVGLGVCLVTNISGYVGSVTPGESNYAPDKFFGSVLTRHNCRNIWEKIMKGYDTMPICTRSPSQALSLNIAKFVRVSGNMLSGEIPPEFGRMQNLSLLHLDDNMLSGTLPPELSGLPLVLLNVSTNSISGPIPPAIGQASCLETLDLSRNNFSGELPASVSLLTKLSVFNVSYNPLLHGDVPTGGQFGTFDERSFLGDPLISFKANGHQSLASGEASPIRRRGVASTITEPWVLFSITVALMTSAATFLMINIQFDSVRRFIPYGHYL